MYIRPDGLGVPKPQKTADIEHNMKSTLITAKRTNYIYNQKIKHHPSIHQSHQKQSKTNEGNVISDIYYIRN